MGEAEKYLKYFILTVMAFVITVVSYGIQVNETSMLHIKKMEAVQAVSVQAESVSYRLLKPVVPDINISIKSDWMYDVQAQVDGVIQEVLVKNGESVQPQQPLMVLKNVDLPNQIAEVQAEIVQAQAKLQNAEITKERYAILAQKDGIAQQDYDNALMQYEIAVADKVAKEAQLEALRTTDAKTVIKAPEAGDVINIYFQPGYYIRSGEAALMLSDFSKLRFSTILSDEEYQCLAGLKQGFLLKIRPYMLKNRSYPEDISEVNKNVTGNISVVMENVFPPAAIPSKKRKIDWEITSGSYFLEPTTYQAVALAAKEEITALAVPCDAVFNRKEEPYVFIVNEQQQAEKRLVKVGLGDGQYVEILAGLAEGESVIVSRSIGLKDKMKVRVRDAGA